MGLNTTILTITKPTLKLDEISIIDRESNASVQLPGVVPSKFVGSNMPFVVINGYEFTMSSLISFNMQVGSFIPTCRLTIGDTYTMFQGKHFPKDGDVISMYIRSKNEAVFKPIRIDFDIIRIDPSYYTKNTEKAILFTIYGQMKIPGLFLEECKSYSSMNSFDVLHQISQDLELGFASNETLTEDIMNWINPYDTSLKFIKDVTSNSYKDEKSFFHSFIDQYYNLNFININGIFSTDTDVIESETYSNILPETVPGLTTDGDKSRSPHVLTNHLYYQGTSKYMVGFKMLNSSGNIFLRNGYKRYSQHFETSSDAYISEFVDPFTTEGSDSQIHLKGRYLVQDEELKYEDILDKYVKYKYLGKQDSSENGTVHKNYTFSNVLNYQNNEEIFKMGMVVDLSIADLSFYKFQRIPVVIYNYDPIAKNADTDTGLSSTPEVNDFLSGFYLISDIEYIYKYPDPIRQRLYLIRREFKLT